MMPTPAITGNEILANQAGPSGPYLVLDDDAVFAAMDLARPGLEQVKTAVDMRDYDAAYAAWADYWAHRQTPLYSLNAAEYAPALRQHLPRAADAIVAKANELWHDDFRHADYQPARSGRTFQWVNQSTTMAYNGFQSMWYIKELGRAFLLTGDNRYPAMFREIICSYWDSLPDFAENALFENKAAGCSIDGISMFWNRGLGSSRRACFALENYFLMRDSAEFTTELHRTLLKLFLGQGRYLFDNGLNEYEETNFQASRCHWIILAGLFLPEFRESTGWTEKGLAILRERIERNFDEDGAQVEQCMQYHLTGMWDMIVPLRLLHANGRDDILAEQRLADKLRSIYDYPAKLAHATGHTAVFNSAVYGTEWQAFLPVGAELFDSKLQAWATKRFLVPVRDYVPVAKNISHCILLIDADWIRAYQQIVQHDHPAPKFTNVIMKDSGMAAVRSGWDANSHSLTFDCNRQPWGGHAYPGRLSFDLFANGTALVVNPGSGIAYTLKQYLDWCYQTIGHNTVMVNNRSQDKPYDAELCSWYESDHVVLVSALTRCYEKHDGIIHHRSILAVRDDYYVILDRLTGGSAGTPLSWMLHSPLDIEAREDGSLASPAGRPGLLVVPDSLTREHATLETGVGFAAVPISHGDNYAPLAAWRDDVPYMRLNSTIDETIGGQTYAVLLQPFVDKAPAATVTCTCPEQPYSLQTYSLRVDWPAHSDSIKVDFRENPATVNVVRKNSDGITVADWS